MTNKRIAEWLGCENIQQSRGHAGRIVGNMPERYELTVIPDYENSNAAAIELLPVLVERGYAVDLFNDGETWLMIAARGLEGTGGYVKGDTISAAITSAVLQLIEREEGK